MAKIGIYIPDDKAAEEIEKWRDRINFSQIFREAFDREVRFQTMLDQGDQDMRDVIERLKKEKQEDQQIGEQQGLEDGAEFAKDTLSLKDIRYYAEEIEEQRNFDPDEAAQDLAKKLVSEGWVDDYSYFDRENVDRETFIRGYFDGFVKGVSEVWEKVKDQI